MPKKSRGGRRPGAGAPPGNTSALRSGKYSKDSELRYLLEEVSEIERRRYVAQLRSGELSRDAVKATIWREIASETIGRSMGSPVFDCSDDSVSTSSPGPLLTQHTSGSIKRSERPHEDTVQRMKDWNFNGARAFVMRHQEALLAIRVVLSELEDMDTRALSRIDNTGAYIRQRVHEEIAVNVKSTLTCPYCGDATPILARGDEQMFGGAS